MPLDLSHPLRSGVQVYPGDPEVRIEPAATVEEHGFAVSALHLGTHSGTHVDAPAHIIDGAPTLDQVPLTRFVGRARVLHAKVVTGADRIDVDDVDLTDVHPGDIVLIATGWDRHYGTPASLRHPSITPALARALLEGGVRTVGVDLLNPDPTPHGEDADQGLPVHDLILGAGGVIYENLRGLTELPATVLFSGLPLNIDGADRSPVRAVAWPFVDRGDDGPHDVWG